MAAEIEEKLRHPVGAEFGDIAEDAMDAIKSKYNLKCRVIFTECFGFADEGRRNGGRASRYAE